MGGTPCAFETHGKSSRGLQRSPDGKLIPTGRGAAGGSGGQPLQWQAPERAGGAALQAFDEWMRQDNFDGTGSTIAVTLLQAGIARPDLFDVDLASPNA
ncbi:hypothetical protein GCM10027514_16680 [Azotobacter armeniacus]